ncbi:DUF2124 family protein [Methanosphaerula palustris]|uniref:DUF2124 family protein n=1 Tax=Methanosphaerula palustris TaxID=475088 RepID=UPI00032188AD|nr:DUF2124 family protein [Methanosphaerula palustris]
MDAGDQIVYYGVPGTCIPFVELLAFALRSLDLEQVFVLSWTKRRLAGSRRFRSTVSSRSRIDL